MRLNCTNRRCTGCGGECFGATDAFPVYCPKCQHVNQCRRVDEIRAEERIRQARFWDEIRDAWGDAE